MADWYYIGHYGQLGPISREQLDDLIDSGVVARDTYVWRTGMPEWLPADRVVDLNESFRRAEPFAAPPPPPVPRTGTPPLMAPPVATAYDVLAPTHADSLPMFGAVRSDKSRLAGGILQLLVPGVGRLYLGYMAHGILQLVLSLCMVGWIWSIIDGIIILMGGVKLDGYGRRLPE